MRLISKRFFAMRGCNFTFGLYSHPMSLANQTVAYPPHPRLCTTRYRLSFNKFPRSIIMESKLRRSNYLDLPPQHRVREPSEGEVKRMSSHLDELGAYHQRNVDEAKRFHYDAGTV